MDLKALYFLNSLTGKSVCLDSVFIFLASYSQYLLGVAFLLFLFFSGYKNKEKIKIFAVTVGSIIISRVFIVELIRLFYHRPRPFLVYNLNQLIPETGYSFPSGHATVFFAASAAIFCYDKRLGILFFIISLLMNISRVIVGVHYLSDIIGGLVLGSLVAFSIYRLVEKKK
ncbi:phosphatase PAP2 family protein [Patescibacteria group bacterium]|nr:phosphatase PAP2 family protein [Patescibacteria group bacterium]